MVHFFVISHLSPWNLLVATFPWAAAAVVITVAVFVHVVVVVMMAVVGVAAVVDTMIGPCSHHRRSDRAIALPQQRLHRLEWKPTC
jgi:hypothetical protein